MARLFRFEVFGAEKKAIFLTQYEESPYYFKLIIHCGVNAIGAIGLYTLIEKNKTNLRFNKVRFSQSLFSNTMWKNSRQIIRCLVYNIGSIDLYTFI